MTPEELAAKEMIKAVYEDGKAEINGREYKFVKMTHKQRRKVFAFYTKVSHQIERGDFSFLDSSDFETVESVINNSVTLNDSLLSRIESIHWDSHPEDYLVFISTALGVISYPFFSASGTG